MIASDLARRWSRWTLPGGPSFHRAAADPDIWVRNEYCKSGVKRHVPKTVHLAFVTLAALRPLPGSATLVHDA